MLLESIVVGASLCLALKSGLLAKLLAFDNSIVALCIEPWIEACSSLSVTLPTPINFSRLMLNNQGLLAIVNLPTIVTGWMQAAA